MNALDMIERERNRQIDEESYTAAFDDQVNAGDELALAAACYLATGTCADVLDEEDADAWPWASPFSDKRDVHDRLRRLVIAGALTLAAIDQELRRLAGQDHPPVPQTGNTDLSRAIAGSGLAEADKRAVGELFYLLQKPVCNMSGREACLLREAAGLSVGQAGRLLGVGQAALVEIEGGGMLRDIASDTMIDSMERLYKAGSRPVAAGGSGSWWSGRRRRC